MNCKISISQDFKQRIAKHKSHVKNSNIITCKTWSETLETVTKPNYIFKYYQFITTAQKVKFSIKDFFSTFDQIPSFLRICSNLLKKSLMKNFIFCAVYETNTALRKYKEKQYIRMWKPQLNLNET